MNFETYASELWPYLFILLAGILPTEIWRWIGVLAAGRLDEDMPAFAYVRAVATALVAGVIAQLILAPSGALASVPLGLRVAAAVIGFAAMEIAGRRGWIGILAGEVVLIAGTLVVQDGA